MDNLKLYNCLLYSSVGDIIGFKNGELKYNKNYGGILTKKDNPFDYIEMGSVPCNYMLYEFIHKNLLQGIISEIDENKYVNSSNIIFLIKITETILKKPKNLIEDIKKNLLNFYENDKFKNKRDYNKLYMANLKKSKLSYDKSNQSSDFAVMMLPLGIIFDKNIDTMIDIIIKIGLSINNNGIFILGGICSAILMNFAYNKNKLITDWGKDLLQFLKNSKFKSKFIKNKEFQLDYDLYIYNFETYLNDRFINNKNYLIGDINWKSEPSNRYEYYFNKFSNNKNIFYPGNSGDDCIIIIYDILIENNLRIYQNKALQNNSQLIKYICQGILNTGNSSNIGSILLSFYGVLENNDKLNNLIIQFQNSDDKIIYNIKKLLLEIA